MNILLLTDFYPADPSHSASEMSHVLHDFARQWSRSENVLVLRPFLRPDWQRKNRKIRSGANQLDGVKMWHAPVLKLPWLPCFSLTGLRRGLRRSGFQPQVIVAHLGFNLHFAHRLAKRMRVPLVAGVHLGDLKFGPGMLGEKRLHRIYRHAAAVACRSPMIFRCFAEKFPELQAKCFIAYSGIDPSLLGAGPTDGKWPEKWGPTSTVRFCTLATLRKYKNTTFTLEALARLSPAIDWKYSIIGDGPEKPALQRLAVSLGIAPRVQFKGFLPTPLAMQELRSCHIFLMPSRETFGLAFLEAMACGLIVIGGRGYGIDGILEDGKNGFLCSTENQAELVTLMEKIVSHAGSSELQTIAANARETASLYSIEKAATNYLRNIQRAI